MADPVFSVVLPVHNGEAYIAQTIESVLSQTYPHLRLLILENASTDRTVEIVRSYADSRLSIHPSADLLSIEANWGRILALDLDEYVTFISHDDLIDPEFLQEITRLIAAEPGASLYQTQYDLIDAQGSVIRQALASPYKETVRDFMSEVHHFRREITSVGSVARSADYKAVGGLPPFAGLLYADTICWYKLTALSYKVCSPRSLAAFRLHAHSATRSSILNTYYEASEQYFDALAQIVPDLSPDEAALAKRHLAKAFQLKHRQILQDLIRGGSTDSYQQYRLDVQKLAQVNDPLFAPFDLYSKVFEGIARVPANPLRQFLLDAALAAITLKNKLAAAR